MGSQSNNRGPAIFRVLVKVNGRIESKDGEVVIRIVRKGICAYLQLDVS